VSTNLLTHDDPRSGQGGVWSYVSPSRLNCWLSCPLKWRLRYVDGIKTPTTPSLFVGKRVHAGLEVHYRHRMLGVTLMPGDVVARMDEAWEQAVAEEDMNFGSSSEEADARVQAANLVRAYLEQAPADEKPLAVEATMEIPLVDPATGEDLGIPMLGIADLVLDGDDGPIVADFKTSSRSAAPIEVTHEIQLTSYGYLFRRTTGQNEVTRPAARPISGGFLPSSGSISMRWMPAASTTGPRGDVRCANSVITTAACGADECCGRLVTSRSRHALVRLGRDRGEPAAMTPE
jgi:CRISPR/Cas system-associated exonuclease Cas4 (RecB family)